MKILTYPNKVLHRKAVSVRPGDRKLPFLIEKMFITMYQYKGMGLAANQVGILKQIVVLNINHKPTVLINPMIIHPHHEVTEEKESCLSIPGYSTTVKRLTEIEVVSLNRYGNEQNFEANGLLARCIQHEYDHLQGILINGK